MTNIEDGALEAVALLNDVIDAVRFPRPFDKNTIWHGFQVYYAVRISGAVEARVAIRRAGLSAELRLIDRALYEYYIRMLFYWIFPERAEQAFMTAPAKLQEYAAKSGTKHYIPEGMEDDVADIVASYPPYEFDRNFADTRSHLLNDAGFRSLTNYAPAKMVLEQDETTYMVDWLQANFIVHGSPVDVVPVALQESGRAAREMYRMRYARSADYETFVFALQYPIYTAVHLDHVLDLNAGVLQRAGELTNRFIT